MEVTLLDVLMALGYFAGSWLYAMCALLSFPVAIGVLFFLQYSLYEFATSRDPAAFEHLCYELLVLSTSAVLVLVFWYYSGILPH